MHQTARIGGLDVRAEISKTSDSEYWPPWTGGWDREEVAKTFGVPVPIIKRYLELRRETGTWSRSRSPVLPRTNRQLWKRCHCPPR